MICIRCLVSGRVQGVWFRQSTRAQAVQAGVEGWAINLQDGRVEVLLCGEESAVNAVREWLWTGSPLSRVDDVACVPQQRPDLLEGFHTG